MIVGPISAWVLKKIDEKTEPIIPIGFELLINNFVIGILGGLFAMLALVVIGPFVDTVSGAAGSVVQALIDARLLPLVDLIVEPAKVLFLNNALNIGVLAPLARSSSRKDRPGNPLHAGIKSWPRSGHAGCLLGCR